MGMVLAPGYLPSDAQKLLRAILAGASPNPEQMIEFSAQK